jgi:flagellar hook-basal body complex protein FliE
MIVVHIDGLVIEIRQVYARKRGRMIAVFIVPINDSISPVESLFSAGTETGAVSEAGEGFSSLFKEIFAEVVETNKITAEDNVRMTMGEIDDLHTLYNNMQKAQISVETFVTLKNTVVDAYEKVMNMQI